MKVFLSLVPLVALSLSLTRKFCKTDNKYSFKNWKSEDVNLGCKSIVLHILYFTFSRISRDQFISVSFVDTFGFWRPHFRLFNADFHRLLWFVNKMCPNRCLLYLQLFPSINNYLPFALGIPFKNLFSLKAIILNLYSVAVLCIHLL